MVSILFSLDIGMQVWITKLQAFAWKSEDVPSYMATGNMTCNCNAEHDTLSYAM